MMASPIKKNAQVLGSVVVFYLIVVIQAHFAIGKKHAFKKNHSFTLDSPVYWMVYCLKYLIILFVFFRILLKTNPDLPNGSNPTSTETKRFFFGCFCWILMEATIFCLIFWIFIRLFATSPCFKKTKN